MYKITITKTKPNPDFEKEYAAFKDSQRYRSYGDQPDLPQREFVENTLTCELTEEEYKKVKAEVIKVFE